MDDSQNHYASRKKPENKNYTLYMTFEKAKL